MRYTTAKGLDDDVNVDLGRDVSLICEIMNIGVALDAITYQATLTGEELLALVIKYCPAKASEANIQPKNRYKVTAYDW